jgi:hypothetical protein
MLDVLGRKGEADLFVESGEEDLLKLKLILGPKTETASSIYTTTQPRLTELPT